MKKAFVLIVDELRKNSKDSVEAILKPDSWFGSPCVHANCEPHSGYGRLVVRFDNTKSPELGQRFLMTMEPITVEDGESQHWSERGKAIIAKAEEDDTIPVFAENGRKFR